MKNILILEDDINIAELERDYLKLNGYNADIESDGALGLKKALLGGYDVIIVDLMLPGEKRVRDHTGDQKEPGDTDRRRVRAQ